MTAQPTELHLGIPDKSILSFSLERWNSVWRSRHHIMAQFARSNKVLFASSPFYIREALRGFWGKTEESSGVSRVSDNLYTYIPPRWLPVNYRYPSLEKRVQQSRRKHLRGVLSQLGMICPILYIWHPSFLDMVGCFDEALVVYHCYDEYNS